jgi:uncharacterized protein (DUF927 family)
MGALTLNIKMLKAKKNNMTEPETTQKPPRSLKNVVISRLITLKIELQHQDNALLAQYVQDVLNYAKQLQDPLPAS